MGVAFRRGITSLDLGGRGFFLVLPWTLALLVGGAFAGVFVGAGEAVEDADGLLVCRFSLFELLRLDFG